MSKLMCRTGLKKSDPFKKFAKSHPISKKTHIWEFRDTKNPFPSKKGQKAKKKQMDSQGEVRTFAVWCNKPQANFKEEKTKKKRQFNSFTSAHPSSVLAY